MSERPAREALIETAIGCLNPHVGPDDKLFGDVGAALVSGRGRVFTGVCVDTASWGLCAERSAIAAMVTAGEYRIETIVAVWRDERDSKVYVLPPCGHCREFMRKVDAANLDTEVILSRDTSARLSALLPAHEWPQPLA
jgi:cytidine deaminase